MLILCILQNAYVDDARRRALLEEHLSFKINPLNHTGKKLHKMLDKHEFFVTNACPKVFSTVNEKGDTDHDRLKLALKERQYDFYISFGKQSNEACSYILDEFEKKPLAYFPHPASRNLTNILMGELKKLVDEQKDFDTDIVYYFEQLKKDFTLQKLNRVIYD